MKTIPVVCFNICLCLLGCAKTSSPGQLISFCDNNGLPSPFFVDYWQSNEPKGFFSGLSFSIDPGASATMQCHYSNGVLPEALKGTDSVDFVFCIPRIPSLEKQSQQAGSGFSQVFFETLGHAFKAISTAGTNDFAKVSLCLRADGWYWKARLFRRTGSTKYTATGFLAKEEQPCFFNLPCSHDENAELEKFYSFCEAQLSNEAENSLRLNPSEFDFGEQTEIERPVLTATLRNDSDRTSHMTDVIRTCVCANLELSTTNLPPCGSAEVRCTVDSNANAPAAPAPHAESGEGAKEPAP